jgi:hypothetical protein
VGKYTRTLIDYDGEKTVFRVHVDDLNASNFDAQLALQVALGSAINGIVVGNLNKIEYGNETISGYDPPDDQWAQRETKWLITYKDAVTNKQYRCELGTADLEQLNPDNRDSAFIGDSGVVDAFVTAFEAYVLSPDTDNAVEIVSIVPVGRNT